MVTTENLRSRALKAGDELPVVSRVLQGTLSLFARPDDVSVAQLAGGIEQDVVIAGTVLAIANSAMYGGYSVIASVRQAIARLGIHKTRNVLLGLSVTRAFRTVRVPSPWTLSRFNAHSLASATLSDLIVRNVRSADPEWAFMAGLLHDIGLLAIATGLPEQFRSLLENEGGDVTLIERERNLLGFSHFELGAELIGRWNCPVPVQEAAQFCQRAAFEFGQPLGLGAVVKSATLLADSHRISNFDSDQNQNVTHELLEALEIPKPAQFITDFHADFNELQTSPA
jgi:HD-like signal output (HDOD) protein